MKLRLVDRSETNPTVQYDAAEEIPQAVNSTIVVHVDCPHEHKKPRNIDWLKAAAFVILTSALIHAVLGVVGR